MERWRRRGHAAGESSPRMTIVTNVHRPKRTTRKTEALPLAARSRRSPAVSSPPSSAAT
jgi:hypothetical protein